MYIIYCVAGMFEPVNVWQIAKLKVVGKTIVNGWIWP